MKLSSTQVERVRELLGELGVKAEVARQASEEFGFKVSAQVVGYWTKPENEEKIPLSENQYKVKTASAEKCVEILKKMAQENPDQVITRNFFRLNSPLSESAWSKHFGTFEEFKRQAGVKLTRHARKMELDVAKHASVDTYRELNVDKREWADNYVRDFPNRFQTVLVGSDIHDIECDPFWLEVFLDTAKRAQPEKIILNGDLFDLPEFGKYSTDPREWDVVGRIKWVHNFLACLRKAAPNAEITLIEGNHEYRLLRHLSETTPAMKAVLADLHGFTVSKLLGLEQFEVNYVAPADLATFTKSDAKAEIRRNWITIYDTMIAHHFPEGKQFGMPGWNGHHHKHLCDTLFNPVQGSYEWHQLGAGHKREASYCNGEKWTLGFMLAHVDILAKRVQFEYTDVTSDFAVVGGKWYYRNDKKD